MPVLDEATEQLLAVLDVDSDDAAAFAEEDQRGLQRVCELLGRLHTRAAATQQSNSNR